MTEQHLDLDALADALAGVEQPHLSGCLACQAALEDLRAASDVVAAELAALPLPPVPDDLEARITAALAAAPPPAASATVLPAASVTPLGDAPSRRTRWLGAGMGIAAAAALVVGGGLLLTSDPGGSSDNATSAKESTGGGPPVTSSGTDYTDTTLVSAVPGLLGARTAADSGSGAAAPLSSGKDPLATLRTQQGLASCLASLDASTAPLALDYARYKGAPALVVVLPASKPSKVEVWVVGETCSDPESQLLHYARVDRPAG